MPKVNLSHFEASLLFALLTSIVLGIVIPFWGVLLAPPLLAVVYAYKARQARMQSPIL